MCSRYDLEKHSLALMSRKGNWQNFYIEQPSVDDSAVITTEVAQ